VYEFSYLLTYLFRVTLPVNSANVVDDMKVKKKKKTKKKKKKKRRRKTEREINK